MDHELRPGHRRERTLRERAVDEQDRPKVQPLMTVEPGGSGIMDVPDPYYSDGAVFEPGIRQGVP